MIRWTSLEEVCDDGSDNAFGLVAYGAARAGGSRDGFEDFEAAAGDCSCSRRLVLAPGLGRTRTGRLWTFVRDDRPFCGSAPPAAAYFFSPDRKAEHPANYLAGFTGFLQADAYAGFAALYHPGRQKPGPITEVGCWAHCRYKLFDVWEATKSPIAREAIDRIAAFYAIEDRARFTPPDERLRHRAGLIDLLDDFFT